MAVAPATWLDALILLIVGGAAILGAVRGAIRGLFSLMAIPAALVLGYRWYRPLGMWLQGLVRDATLSLVMAFSLLVVGAVIAVILIGAAIRGLALRLKLGSVDGLMGVLLGAAKGVLVSGLALWVALGVVPGAKRVVDASAWAVPAVEVARRVVRAVGAQLPEMLPADEPGAAATKEV
jgi:membrane protein required for colicin V production